MQPLDKKQKKELRRLAALAHERALSAALGALQGHFLRWRQGALDAFELNDEVHRHHQGAAREIYLRYTGSDPRLAVACALGDGLLAWEDVDESCRPLLEALVRAFAAGPGDGP
ncbi:MAG: hypothetical protein KF823_02490 [Xanthomonadales bacterium]|nr:hypothetical protein [Xanthomonadales bacterium]